MEMRQDTDNCPTGFVVPGVLGNVVESPSLEWFETQRDEALGDI